MTDEKILVMKRLQRGMSQVLNMTTIEVKTFEDAIVSSELLRVKTCEWFELDQVMTLFFIKGVYYGVTFEKEFHSILTAFVALCNISNYDCKLRTKILEYLETGCIMED